MIKVLFVCLGNICRSPLAEGIFAEKVRKAGLENQIKCDSAGTANYHEGELPDPRSRKVAENQGFTLTHHARKLRVQDFSEFDYILAMDKNNLRNIELLQEKSTPKSQLFLMRHFDPQKPNAEVDDPYYGGLQDFEHCYQVLEPCAENLLAFLVERHTIKPII